MLDLIVRVRAHGADIVNDNGTLFLRGSVPDELLAEIRSAKPELTELLHPASTARPFTVRAPVERICQDCGGESMVMIRLGDELFCRSCLIADLPALTDKPANCRHCGLRIVKSEAFHTKTNGKWYCSKEGCYKQWGFRKRLEDKLKAGSKPKKPSRKTGTSRKGRASQTLSDDGQTKSQSSDEPKPIVSPAPSKTEPFDWEKADQALRARGLTLVPDCTPEPYQGGWRIAVVSRVVRQPLGYRVVRPSPERWTVDPAVYRGGRWHATAPTDANQTSDEFDPLGGASWRRK